MLRNATVMHTAPSSINVTQNPLLSVKMGEFSQPLRLFWVSGPQQYGWVSGHIY